MNPKYVLFCSCGEHIILMSYFGTQCNFLSFEKDKKLYP